ncbi:MAG: alpha/beta hydrolase fold domain-containing protein, partial [Trueperella pyogenes]|nr:alpha/beta hydrolase fold domain-containing protein [Trueperella pyogenes]
MSTYPIYLRPELAPIIAETPEQTTWDLPAMRAGGDALLANPHEADSRVEVSARGRTFIPADLAEDAPLIISIHGGGYVAGRAAFDDAKNDELATRFGAIVVSPEYRLAPEFPFPIPVDDCISALAEALERFGHERPTFILGDSAGAGLAYSMVSRLCGLGLQMAQDEAIAARYKRIASLIRGIILLEPCVDPTLSTPSSRFFAEGPVWTRRAAAGAWRHYFGVP